MSTATEKMLSVAEVFEMTPGDSQNATWINPGMIAVVAKIQATKVKATGRPMNICTLRDQTGSAEISMTVFSAVNFGEGDVIEVGGQGFRRTEYNGMAQVTLGKTPEIHVLGKSVHHNEQTTRKEHMEPSINGTKQHVNGQTVGMAIKESLLLVREGEAGAGLDINNPDFWKQVHKTASAIIRLSNALEHGNLTPSLSAPRPAAPAAEQAPQGGRADPPKPKAKPEPGPGGAVKHDENDEDVQF